MKVSERGLAFIAGHEGFVSRGYRDTGGVVTIGYGFTMRSKVFAAWWLAKYGRKLRVNDRMNQAESDDVLARMLSEEYEKAVRSKMPPNAKQHQFDAATSAVYNLGSDFMDWQAARLWIAGKVKDAAGYWATHYNTVRGCKVAGLVRRRKEEAHLFLTGNYAGVREGDQRTASPAKPEVPDPVVMEVQKALKRFGFDPGGIDGWMGTRTKDAVIAYQKTHPNLENDGIIGPATLAQLRKDLLALKETVTGSGGIAGLGVASFFAGLPWGWIAAGGAGLLCLWLVIRYRDSIARWINQLGGVEVA
ncbi:glycoside hydrolase family protein [Roseibium litorale]|uniref:Lysozyme n=1 Tax=Roseibium litorale TaxID=2803841 RepID=A0ABR9CT38_9HYPH|nr:peptidoglycan-binding protein [Roseibium litorale]MBD8894047.1 peptidoglycan-binding protein [Roseibium litorale]